MLVHVTRFVDVQSQVAQLIQQQVDSIRRRLAIGEGERRQTLLSDLKKLWQEEFEPTSAQIRGMSSDENLPEVSWAQVAAELPEAAGRIEVKEINGHATDALDYVAHRQGFNVVAVGGDKLSRGLTLEGLSVSYFLRASQMYDTLMQMGRWFGYRPGYLDLCRLFTTEDLRRWYRHIALAEVELRREFDRMKAAGLTPRRYGLRVREHPGGLLVTAMNKMSHAQTQRLSYAGDLVQTPTFSTDLKVVQTNRKTVSNFLNTLGGSGKADPLPAAWLWKIKAKQLLNDLMPAFSIAPECWRLQKPELCEFIRRQADDGELTDWTIAVINKQTATASERYDLSDLRVGITTRTPETDTWPKGPKPPQLFRAPNSNIQDPAHHTLDLIKWKLDDDTLAALLEKRAVEGGAPVFNSDEAALLASWRGRTLHEIAVDLTARRHPRAEGATGKQSIRGDIARQLRPKTHGLLTIYSLLPKDVSNWPMDEVFMGLAFSFPSSHTARAVDYKVNKVWQATFHDEDYAD